MSFCSALSIAQWLTPEILMFLGSIIVFVILKRACREASALDSVNVETSSYQNEKPEANPPSTPNVIEPDEMGHGFSLEKWKVALNIGKFLSLITLCVAGAIQPAVPSFIYFAVFLGAATWWGCNKELERYLL